MENGYSLSDMAAVTGGNNAWGGGIWVILILIFLLGGGNWNRSDGYGQFATAASQQEILFNQHFNNLDNKMDRGFTSIGNGIADATFALNNTVINESRRTQDAVGQNRFDMANYNAGVLAAIAADGEKTRGLITQNKIEALQGRINQLELQNAMNGVVRYPNGFVYNAGTNPFCGCGNSCC